MGNSSTRLERHFQVLGIPDGTVADVQATYIKYYYSDVATRSELYSKRNPIFFKTIDSIVIRAVNSVSRTLPPVHIKCGKDNVCTILDVLQYYRKYYTIDLTSPNADTYTLRFDLKSSAADE